MYTKIKSSAIFELKYLITFEKEKGNTMITINQKTKERFIKGVKKYKKVLEKASIADINESDTVTIITDIMENVFGYEKFENITSEYAIKKTFCDLAVKVEGNVKYLIECKAIGLSLKNDFIRQATNYAANEGVEYVVLTNGIHWQVYNIEFSQPIENKLLAEFNFFDLSIKNAGDLELLYFLSIEANKKNSKYTLHDLKEQKSIMNKFVIGQLLKDESISECVRKQLRKICPDLKITREDISKIINAEILKREIVEGEDAEEAKKKIAKLVKKSIKK